MRRSHMVAYAVAAILPVVAVMMTGAVEGLRDRVYMLPLGAVIAGAWIGGIGPGLLATFIGTVLLGVTGLSGGTPLRAVTFVVLAALVSVAGEVQRRARADRKRLLVESEEAEKRFAFLAEASSVLGASLDYDVTLRNVARLTVPFLADWCTIDLLEADGNVRRIGVAHGNPGEAELVRAAEVYPPDPESRHPRTRVLRSGRPELIAEISDADLALAASNPEQLRVMRAIGYRSALIVPLAARGHILGVMTLATAKSGRRYGTDHLALAEDVARRAALAIENARLYRDARAARAEAEAASRAKDEFLSVVSHELRTPLTSVLLWARVLNRGGLDRVRAAHAAEMIERNSRRQARLVEDLLDVSRIVTGSLKLDLRPVDLCGPIEAAVAAVRPLAEEKRIRLTTVLPGQPPSVMGDPRRLEQLVSHLVANAVEFTPEDGSIDVTLEVNEGDVRRVRLKVVDSGEGIDAELLPHVFDRFRQGDSTSTRRHGGLGLGLTIARELAALHGGTVHAESPGKGQGATFTVDLPLAIEAQARAS